jgi:hypothetical protein
MVSARAAAMHSRGRLATLARIPVAAAIRCMSFLCGDVRPSDMTRRAHTRLRLRDLEPGEIGAGRSLFVVWLTALPS